MTVCANIAGEICLTWRGKPSASHWSVQKPASDDGGESEKRQTFKLYFKHITERVTSFIKGLENSGHTKELAFKIQKQSPNK